MTSIPASRSARAITLAPRSCPSRPGFAITTLIMVIPALAIARLAIGRLVGRLSIWRLESYGRLNNGTINQHSPNHQSPTNHPISNHPISNDRLFLILSPHVPQRVAHLADRGVGAHGLEQ